MNKKIKENEIPEEEKLYVSLRADDWDSFIGQEKVKESLQTSIKAAKQRSEPMEHALLYGPPGLGKTTLSHLIAREMGVNIRLTSGPAIEHAGDLASILTNLENNDILFIDEIHRLSKVVEEALYPAMEDFALDIIIGKGPSARTVRLELPHFTLVGATTRIGLMSAPLRDRFVVTHRLAFYEPKHLVTIIENASKKLKVPIEDKAKDELSKRARGTPRIAIRLLKRVRDVAQVHGEGTINDKLLAQALEMLEVDPLGLDNSDQRYLLTIIDKFGGGPVGIETMAAALSEDVGTIEEVIEPYLMQVGLVKRTPRGRVVTEVGYKHMNREVLAVEKTQDKLL